MDLRRTTTRPTGPGPLTGCLATLAMVALAGCASLPGAGIPSTGSAPTLGEEARRTSASERYAFARARVPITITGESVESRRPAASGAPQYIQTLRLDIGAPKYAVDRSVSTRIAAAPGDGFRYEIDGERLLRSVTTAPAPGAAAPSSSAVLDVLAELSRGYPVPATSRTITRTASLKLSGFRHEAEIDPAEPAEVGLLTTELGRLAKGWGLKVSFAAMPAQSSIAGQRIDLAPVRSPQCGEPVCFRLPIPYRLAIEAAGPGWRGKLETSVWLANEGPVGALDVRHPDFAGSGTTAMFENGMLRSLATRDQALAAAFLRIPAVSHTASAAR